jgi:Na+-driven multidrug efflux pump
MAVAFRAAKNLEELATGHTGRLLLKYSWPALVAMSLNALYCVVDRMFIGQGCGVDAMAGLTLTMPVMMFFAAFGVLIGAGHAAVLSIKLGEGDRVACEKLLGQLVALKLLFFALLPLLVFLNLDRVLACCGAARVTPGAVLAAKDYLRIVLFSQLFSHLAFGLSALQRAEGGALRSMICMAVGFGLNALLDPLFIFVFRLGVAGAAWATTVAMMASCACALGYYLREKSVVRLRWRRIGLHRGLLAQPLGVGFSPFLQHFMSSMIAVSLQLAFAKWMPDPVSRTNQIASLGVFHSALILVIMPMLGAQQGLQPILGYNWGARRFSRVRAALAMGLAVTSVLSVAAFVVQVVPPFPYWLARLFISGDNPALAALAARDLQVANSMIWCISVNVVATTYFQSIGRPALATGLSFLRQGVCLLPIIWGLPYVMDDKPLAIWLSMPVSDVLCLLATVPPLYFCTRRKLPPCQEQG